MGYKENLYWNTLWTAMELALTVSRTEQNELSKMIHWILFLTNELSSNWKCNHVHMSYFLPASMMLLIKPYMFVHASFCSHNGFLCLVSIQETSNHKLDFVMFRHAMHEQFEYFHHWKFS